MSLQNSQRFILWLVAALLVIPQLIKGHCPSRKSGESVAFLHVSTAQVTVRVKGAVPFPGIYHFPDGATIATVINMTMAVPADKMMAKVKPDTLLKSGDVVELQLDEDKNLEITLCYMDAKESMVLGIPLHPDLLDVAGWDTLPGIGPELAKRIVSDRQINGDFYSVDALKRVPGVGEGKIRQIRGLFARR